MKGGAWVAIWVVGGAVGVAGFAVSSFLPEFSVVGDWGYGFSLLIMPLLFGFLVGMLLIEHDLSTVAVAALLMTVVSLGLIGVYFFAPVLAGLPSVVEELTLFNVRAVGVSAILIFPLALTGSIMGHGFSTMFLASTNLRREVKALQEQTKRWHEELEQIEHRETLSRDGQKKA